MQVQVYLHYRKETTVIFNYMGVFKKLQLVKRIERAFISKRLFLLQSDNCSFFALFGYVIIIKAFQ